jgi:hypothetical protein
VSCRCTDGWTGPTCSESTTTQSPGIPRNTIIGISIGASVALVAIIVTGAVIIFVTQRKRAYWKGVQQRIELHKSETGAAQKAYGSAHSGTVLEV